MPDWTIERIVLPLRYTWKISRNSSDLKTNFYIYVKKDDFQGVGEVAPNIRYQESPEKILSEFGVLINNGLPQVKNIVDLNKLLGKIKVSNALKCGLVAAMLDLESRHNAKKIMDSLHISHTRSNKTIFTIPIVEPQELASFYVKNKLERFDIIKLKVDKDTASASVDAFVEVSKKPFIIDGNETWTDPDVFMQLSEIWKQRQLPILFIEQPLPSYQVESYMVIKDMCPYELFADESITLQPDFIQLKKQFHGVNIKLMKCGGLIEAVKQIKQAKLFGLKTMVGCMVETTVAISQALIVSAETNYADLDSFLYLESEPLKWLTEKDGILTLNY